MVPLSEILLFSLLIMTEVRLKQKKIISPLKSVRAGFNCMNISHDRCSRYFRGFFFSIVEIKAPGTAFIAVDTQAEISSVDNLATQSQ